jgi:hypothetical protein
MTNIYEFDFRHSWTIAVLDSLDQGILQIANELPDGLDQVEHIEEVVGIAFVALQGYISGAEADMHSAFSIPKQTSQRLRKENCPTVSGVPLIGAIWAAANYYKHHDQWPDWKPIGQRRETITTLARLGISKDTEFPCVKVHRAVTAHSGRLVQLLGLVTAWREMWISVLRDSELT